MDTELDVLAESLVELGEVVLVLGDLGDKIEGLLDNVLADDFENLVLLESLTRDVERKILRVDDTLDEVEILGNELFAVIHDEDAADIELDVVAFLLRLKEIEGSTMRTYQYIHFDQAQIYSPLRDEQDSLELELTLDGEVLDSEMILPVVGQALVEGSILLGSDILRIAGPDGLGLVKLLVGNLLLLDLLLLLFLALLLLLDLLNLGLLALFLFLDFLVVFNFLNYKSAPNDDG